MAHRPAGDSAARVVQAALGDQALFKPDFPITPAGKAATAILVPACGFSPEQALALTGHHVMSSSRLLHWGRLPKSILAT